jgi:ArsR family transcriptional regulator
MDPAKLDVRALSRLFRALGDETRLRIVALLSHGELCVCHVEEALGLTQPTASRHLSVLKAAGVVEPRREGTWIYYSLAAQTDEECKRQLRAVVKSFADKDLLRRDVERLVRIRGPESCP